MSIMKRLLTVWLLLWCAITAHSRHIHGGDITMQALNTTGLFRIEVNQFVNGAVYDPSTIDPQIRINIFQKQNPQLIEGITLRNPEITQLVYGNEACSKARRLNIVRIRYSIQYQFDVSRYTDPGGYYIVWERCCRDNDITNLAGAGDTGMAFYMEFPAMNRNGQPFRNSSPEFLTPNGAYICVNTPFTMNFSARDADGDQLRYSLVTPYRGYTTSSNLNGTTQPRDFYPPVTWAPGINEQNAIPGSPALRINPGTGELTVRPTQVGMYVFTVLVEEVRNGAVIGLVRRDFQLPVVDCSMNTPPPAVIMQGTTQVRDLNWCSKDPLVLNVEAQPGWAFQWQLNGNNIPGENRPTLTVKESGVYSVVKSFSNQCSRDTISEEAKVMIGTGVTVKINPARRIPICDNDTLTLSAVTSTAVAGQEYSWLLDGQPLAGANRPSLLIRTPGLYTVRVSASGAECVSSDTLRVRTVSPPNITIQSTATRFCEGDSLRLSTAVGADFTYAWSLNGNRLSPTANQIFARQSGTYSVLVTTPELCRVTATTTLVRYDKPVVTMDSLAPVCSAAGRTLTLRGQPSGGAFTGTGVQGVQFNPAVAGPGQHRITYKATNANGCSNETSRTVQVLPPPTVQAETSYLIFEGDSVRLNVQTNVQQGTFRWTPPSGLNNTQILTPTAAPTQTTSYVLTITEPAGCSATASVAVEVARRLYMPDAFSPNGDGINDTWVIQNIDTYRNCEVMIYNRWGELVFFSKGYEETWDGRYQGNLLPAGIYSYRIKTGYKEVTYKGQFVMIR